MGYARIDGVSERSTEVGTFKPNAFGLYDMHGNVWEWVEDCYKDSYSNAPADETAVTSGNCEFRVRRGGSWSNHPSELRSTRRDSLPNGFESNNVGFRVARNLARLR